MTEKRIFDARWTMKNWMSYVLNTVSSRGHKGWRVLKFGENLSARFLPNFNALQPEWPRLETVLGR